MGVTRSALKQHNHVIILGSDCSPTIMAITFAYTEQA